MTVVIIMIVVLQVNLNNAKYMSKWSNYLKSEAEKYIKRFLKMHVGKLATLIIGAKFGILGGPAPPRFGVERILTHLWGHNICYKLWVGCSLYVSSVLRYMQCMFQMNILNLDNN